MPYPNSDNTDMPAKHRTAGDVCNYQEMEMDKPTIKHRYTEAVLFEGDTGMTTRQMLEKATAAKADLRGADLRGAYLYGAYLYGANLCGKKLVGDRPFLAIGPIGSRSDYLQAFITDAGVMIRAGCFFDTRDQFALAIAETHGMNNHGTEYLAALALIDAHAELWAPKVEALAA